MDLLNTYIFQNPFVGITVTDGNGICLTVNDAQTRITGIPKEKIIGKDLKKTVKDQMLSISSTIEALKTKQEVNLHQVSAYGRAYDVKGLPIFDDAGRLVYTISYIVEVTELERFQSYVREREMDRENMRDQVPVILAGARSKEGIVYNSAAMRDIINLAVKVSESDATVLITGSSGTGKELVASLIHKCGDRADKPFIKLNCAAIPENLLESELFGYAAGAFTGGDRKGRRGIFEAANGGSLLLDEIGEMPMSLQAKLLRVLQDSEVTRISSETPIHVDVRIIASTNAPLQELLTEKRFRKDLYYRLNVIHIDIPDLQKRRDDIPVLIAYFIDKFNKKYNTAKIIRRDVVNFLASAEYPGNVRELRNVMERLVLQSGEGEIRLSDAFTVLNGMNLRESCMSPLTVEALENKSLKKIMDDYERQILNRFMEMYKRSDEAAKRLEIDRSTLLRKLKKHNL
ncbi:MAG: sigma 54-interacting transcriptional regulator [Clostridiales Family XIII bacterium]|nr:sigma 54-interacting transcriptional regulator [Clostridiales Family XIII bacterium]